MLDLNARPASPKLLSPLALAFLGDAVYELCVRQRIVGEGNIPVNNMHQKSVKLVNAAAQSAAFEKICGHLTAEELEIYKRGRNANATSAPKHADVGDYRRATGLEALFGYLYLKGEVDRINQIFDLANLAGQPQGQEALECQTSGAGNDI